jgi:Domain of unknown function (DUF4340)
MRKLFQMLYRFFIGNAVIKWFWILLLAIYSITWVSERYLGKRKTVYKKTILRIANHTINTFTINQANDEDMTFTRLKDSIWLVVKDDVTVRVHEDSIAAYLKLFNEMQSSTLKKLPDGVDSIGERLYEKPQMDIDLRLATTAKRAFSIYYVDYIKSDSAITFIKLPKERFLYGVKGDLLRLFNRDFKSFRSKTLLSFNAKDVAKLEFRTRTDSMRFYAKDSVNWGYATPQYLVSNTLVSRYLNAIDTLKNDKYYDATREPLIDENIENQLVITRKRDSIVLTAYRLDSLFVLHSSQNEQSYFKTDSVRVKNLFYNPNLFLKAKPKAKTKKKAK